MDRKVALATAAAVVLTVSAGTAAVAANLGLLSSTTDEAVGQLQPARSEGASTPTIVDNDGDEDAYNDDAYEDDGDDHGDDGYEDDEHDDDDDDEEEDEHDDDDGRDDDD